MENFYVYRDPYPAQPGSSPDPDQKYATHSQIVSDFSFGDAPLDANENLKAAIREIMGTTQPTLGGGSRLRRRDANKRSSKTAQKQKQKQKQNQKEPRWVSTGSTTTLRSGRACTVYRHSKTGELRVRQRRVSAATGEVSYAYVKPR